MGVKRKGKGEQGTRVGLENEEERSMKKRRKERRRESLREKMRRKGRTEKSEDDEGGRK